MTWLTKFHNFGSHVMVCEIVQISKRKYRCHLIRSANNIGAILYLYFCKCLELVGTHFNELT